MFWTIRRILVLIGILSTVVVIATLWWLSNSYEKFSIKTFNDSSGNIASFLVRQAVEERYLHDIFGPTDSWARDRILVSGARENNADKAKIGADATFNTKEVADKIILLEGVHVFDKELKPLTYSDKGTDQSVLSNPQLVTQLNERDTQAKRKAVTFLWQDKNGQPRHSLIMPIGGFKVAGFVEYITNPIPRLKNLGSALSGDVKILDGKGAVLLETSNAPESDQSTDGATKSPTDGKAAPAPVQDSANENLETLLVDIPASVNGKWLTVSLTRDIGDFKSELQFIRNQAMTIIAFAILLCAVGGWLLLKLAVFSKLSIFANAMDRLGCGETGVNIPATGSDEFRVMASALERLKETVRQAFRQQRIIENNTSSIVLCDLDGKVSYCNMAARAFLNLGDGQTIEGESCDLFNQGEEFVNRLLDPEQLPLRAQLTIAGKHIDLDAQSVLSSHGNHVSTVLTWTDISQQEAERQLASKIMEEVTAISETVTQQAQSLNTLSQSLSEQSEKTVSHSHQAREISEKNSHNATDAAATTDQLRSNFGIMSERTANARKTAEAALNAAQTGNAAIEELEQSSSKIGEVTKLIDDVAAQTRMLALNATIEAERAGAAGKGFAVVASEVGRLAGLTTNATSEISQMINSVQQQVVDAKSAIDQINEVISQIHGIQVEVSETVQQQEASTTEISYNVSGISDGSGEIDTIICRVGQEAEKTGQLSSDLRATSVKLMDESVKLQNNIDRYLVHMNSVESHA